MQARISSDEQSGAPAGRTFTESARRTQIVQAAIEVIADVGYAKTSFAKIAKQAGLSSTGMISYHFKGKDDLMHEVVVEVMRVAEVYIVPRMAEADGYRGRLRAYIEANVELLAAFPKYLPALTEVVTHLKGDDPHRIGFAGTLKSIMDVQEHQMRAAQQAGEFRDFDVRVMVTALRGAIDGVVVRSAADPGLDIAACGRELADIFDLATRSTP
ncbi:TetR/AcrR family transcriptional regulator [Saccharothrix sp. ST-888]|uniref:TetR/AcrR family transcriptional regulator n=1 Tax=Saccharothrix sp. ST-888 TaxID=1427391 RepID=UPI0005ED093A|nr:TetR family transcriptional regulator [Saccharothrix sp. ST-888]KJK59347.1 TetR family transcriptional regulator [Saccharothrix sp. ST-888]